MPEPVAMALFGAMTLFGLAVWLLVRSRDVDVSRRIAARFMDMKIATAQAPRVTETRNRLLTRIMDELMRAGFTPSVWHLWAAVLGLSLLGLLGWSWKQDTGLLIVPLFAVAVSYAALRWQYRKRAAAMLRQLPIFLDQMIRGLSAGRTVDNAFTLAAERTTAPLKMVLDRVSANVQLGVELGTALSNAARLHDLREMQLLALAIHVNQRYGGSVRDLLESLINMIRQRQHAQDELRALTGETRFSAWVLSLLPTAMAIYMMAMNPGYLEMMWSDPSGRIVLSSAIALQVVGVLLLWRMIRSI